MNWLVRHIDSVLLGVAVVLSAVWVSIVHPLTERQPMVIINDQYVPPKVLLPQSTPQPSTLSRAVFGLSR
jgi:hypothetical protein